MPKDFRHFAFLFSVQVELHVLCFMVLLTTGGQRLDSRLWILYGQHIPVLFTRAEGLCIKGSYNQIDFNYEIVPICVFQRACQSKCFLLKMPWRKPGPDFGLLIVCLLIKNCVSSP